MEKLLTFYMGEDKGSLHPLEEEYRQLASLSPEKRSQHQLKRLCVLAQALSNAVDASNQAFKAVLDAVKEHEENE